MQLLTLGKSQTTKLFWVVAVVLVAVMLYTGKQEDPGVVATALLLALIAAYPLYFWLLGWSKGLPVWPVFSLVNGTFAALPMVQAPETLDAYTSNEIIAGGVTLIGFIMLGTAVWLGVTSRRPNVPSKVIMVSREHADRYLFAFIAAGLFFQLNFLFWWLNLPGNILSIVRGVTLSLNTLGIFVLAFYAGRRMLSRPKEFLLVALTAGTSLAAAATLIMATGIVPVAMLLLGYALGSGKVPWKGILVVFVLAAVLHPGKFAMRNLYWSEDRPRLTLLGMPQYFGDWLGYGLEEMGVTKSDGRDADRPETTSLFERAGNIHMLLLVQRKSPDEVPFLNGITYEPIPRLLIPRIIDEEKGISHAGNVLLTVNYGVQSLEQTQTTSIYWGLVPEAYANFGYLGVAGLAVVLGLFYGFIANLTVGVPLTSLRFVLGLLIMGAATKADTMGVFVTSQFQGVVGVSLAALVLMRRERNPFAVEDGEGIRQKAYGRMEKIYGIRPEDGMPAPGGLANLIEGAQPEAGMRHEANGRRVREQVSGLGGTVRALRGKLPKRATSWMPKSMQRQVIAARTAAASASAQNSSGVMSEPAEGAVKESRNEEQQRPRQVGVPFRHYRQYRGT